MDKVVIVFCILIIIFAFYLVIRSIIHQFRGGKCAGCPSGGCPECSLKEKSNCSSCGKTKVKMWLVKKEKVINEIKKPS